MFGARIEQIKRTLRDNPEDVDTWIEYCCLCHRLGDTRDLASMPSSARLREALWKRVTLDLTLVVAILPVFGLEVPGDAVEPPGRFWEGHYRLGRGDGFFYDLKTGFPLEVDRIRDRARMVLVPDGPIQKMAVDSQGREVVSRRTRPVSAFLADRHPITVRQYGEFLEDRGSSPPGHWQAQQARPDRPVVFVTQPEAEAYADWVNARLLGSLGWEKALRGTTGAAVPWRGSGRPSRYANLLDLERDGPRSPEGWNEALEEVGLRPDGVSCFGLHEGAGNVREWCGDSPQSLRPGEFGSRFLVAGSSWLTPVQGPFLPCFSEARGTRSGDLGFRLGRPLAAMVHSIDDLDLQRR